jgi:hypothetical protein
MTAGSGSAPKAAPPSQASESQVSSTGSRASASECSVLLTEQSATSTEWQASLRLPEERSGLLALCRGRRAVKAHQSRCSNPQRCLLRCRCPLRSDWLRRKRLSFRLFLSRPTCLLRSRLRFLRWQIPGCPSPASRQWPAAHKAPRLGQAVLSVLYRCSAPSTHCSTATTRVRHRISRSGNV